MCVQYKQLLCLIRLVDACGTFLKVMDSARFGETCLSAYRKTAFPTNSLDYSLERENGASYVQRLFSILFSDVKGTRNYRS